MTKNKHDHTATKKIKAWLFAIMLLLPFLFLLPTGLYYGLNQNAQLSERTVIETNYYKNATSIPNNFDHVEEDTLYGAILCQYQGNEQIVYFEYVELTSYTDIVGYEEYTEDGINYLSYDGEYWLNINGLEYEFAEGSIFSFVFVIDYNANNLNNFTDFEGQLSLFNTDIQVPNGQNTTTTNTNDISTSIINAWNSTWQNPLFSWTTYSPFYAPMQSFTSVFGIDNMQIANVLTYLATITAIYIVFDIIIELFTYLTHLIPRSD